MISRSYSYLKRLELITKDGLDDVIPAYPGSISTKYSFLDEQELIYPTGLTLISSQILPGNDFYYNLIINCSKSVAPLKTCVISFKRSFEFVCNKLIALETGAQLSGHPQRLIFDNESKTLFNQLNLNEDLIQINTDPPLRIDDLIQYMNVEVKNWGGIFFIDDLNSFLYDDEQHVLEKLYLFSTLNQRPVIINRRTDPKEGEYDDKRAISFLHNPFIRTVCNHTIYVGWSKNECMETRSKEDKISVYIDSYKDSGDSKFNSLNWNYQTGIIFE